MKIVLLLIVSLFSFFYGNTKVEDSINNKKNNDQIIVFEKKGSLSSEEVNFLKSLSSQIIPQVIPYSFFSINPKKSYPVSLYEKAEKKLIYEQNQNRVKQAKIYQESGNIKEFKEILLDLFTHFNYSLVAPEVAMLLGDFEYQTDNFDLALIYYLYVVNNHFYSPWGEEAYLKLAFTLSKNFFFLKAIEIMQKILSDTKNSNFKKQAKDFLKKHYLLLAQTAYHQKEYDEAKKYLDEYSALE